MNKFIFGESKFAIAWRGRDFQEEVEVVCHEAIGENAAPGKPLYHPHEKAEMLFFFILEEKLAVNHTGGDVVAGKVRESAIGIVWNDESRCGHGESLDEGKLRIKKVLFN
jgi:hypothetical protein